MPNDASAQSAHSTQQTTYLLVSPRLERKRGAGNERRRSERFVARIDVEENSTHRAHFTTVDVSVGGLLVLARAPSSSLPALRQPLMLTLHLPDGPMLAMAVVARHTSVGGAPALGLRFLGMTKEREVRWLRAIAQLAEARRSNALIERALAPSSPRRESEYILVATEASHAANS